MVVWSRLSADLAQDADFRLLEGLGVEMAFEAPEQLVDVVRSHLG